MFVACLAGAKRHSCALHEVIFHPIFRATLLRLAPTLQIDYSRRHLNTITILPTFLCLHTVPTNNSLSTLSAPATQDRAISTLCLGMFARQLLYGVLICREHCCAVYGLDKHLKQHHSMPAAKRRALLDSYKDFDVLLPAEVSLPLAYSNPIPGLQLGRYNVPF
jgi:hypothetical protein